MATSVTWTDDGNLYINLDTDAKWAEIVYGGKANVTLLRGEPVNGAEDRIVSVEIEWTGEGIDE